MSLLDRIARELGYYTSADVANCVKAAETAATKKPVLPSSSVSDCDNNQTPEDPIPDHYLHYFFSYSYLSCACKSGFGCSNIGLENPIKSFADIEYCTTLIANRLKKLGIQTPNVVIINWQLLQNPNSNDAPATAPLLTDDLLRRIA